MTLNLASPMKVIFVISGWTDMEFGSLMLNLNMIHLSLYLFINGYVQYG